MTSPSTVVELGFQQDGYSVSEQASLNDNMICAVINSGTLERDIVVSLTAIDTTTTGRYVDY